MVQNYNYDFADTLRRLNDLNEWLNSIGIIEHNRVRVYRANIRRMLEIQERNELHRLQETISHEQAREIFSSYSDSDEVVRAVDALRTCCKDDDLRVPIERALNGPADLFVENANNNEGRNFMFELILGGRLATAGYRPSFASGPDLQFGFAGLQVSVECKRPFSERKLEKNIRKGIDQIESTHADLRMLAISVSRLINPGDPNSIPRVPHVDDTIPYLAARVEQIALQTQRFWSGTVKHAGIYFYAFTPIHAYGLQHVTPGNEVA